MQPSGGTNAGNCGGAADDIQALQVLQAAGGRGAGGGHDGAVERVDVEADVDRAAAQRLNDLLDVIARLIAAPVHVQALRIGVDEVSFGLRDGADADRHQRHVRVIEHAAHGGCVRVVLAEVAVAQVGVGVELQHDEVFVGLGERADRAGRQRVFAADDEREFLCLKHLGDDGFELLAVLQVVSAGSDTIRIGIEPDAPAIELLPLPYPVPATKAA